MRQHDMSHLHSFTSSAECCSQVWSLHRIPWSQLSTLASSPHSTAMPWDILGPSPGAWHILCLLMAWWPWHLPTEGTNGARFSTRERLESTQWFHMVSNLIFSTFTLFLLGLLKYSCGLLRDQAVQLAAHPTQRLIASPQQLVSVRPPTEFCPDINTRSKRQQSAACESMYGKSGNTRGERRFKFTTIAPGTPGITRKLKIQVKICFCQCWRLSMSFRHCKKPQHHGTSFDTLLSRSWTVDCQCRPWQSLSIIQEKRFWMVLNGFEWFWFLFRSAWYWFTLKLLLGWLRLSSFWVKEHDHGMTSI